MDPQLCDIRGWNRHPRNGIESIIRNEDLSGSGGGFTTIYIVLQGMSWIRSRRRNEERVKVAGGIFRMEVIERRVEMYNRLIDCCTAEAAADELSPPSASSLIR